MDIPFSINMDKMEFKKETITRFFSFLYEVKEDWIRGTNPIILIVGRSQMGKSTTASIITEQLIHKLPDIQFDPTKHIKGKVEEFLELIRDNFNSILVNEESEDELYSGDWGSLENKLFHKVLVSQGKHHNIYIMILHRFNDLNKSNRLKINWLITQIDRGKALVQKVVNKPNDPTDEIKLSGVNRYPSIAYAKDQINQELWEKWEKVVNPMKDLITENAIQRLKDKNNPKHTTFTEEIPEMILHY